MILSVAEAAALAIEAKLVQGAALALLAVVVIALAIEVYQRRAKL
jgi:hypothetical protein